MIREKVIIRVNEPTQASIVPEGEEIPLTRSQYRYDRIIKEFSHRRKSTKKTWYVASM